MKEDEHHIKLGSNHPCSNCGSSNTWMIDVVPEGETEIEDSGIFCEDCKSFYV